MKGKLLLSLFAITLINFSAIAQDATTVGTKSSASITSPADKWELGVQLGLPVVIGDVDAKLGGIGAGLSLRKSLDHVFSLRGVGFFGQAKNEAKKSGDARSSELTYYSAAAQVVITMNNLRFNKPHRNWNFNFYAGAGINGLSVDYKNISNSVNQSPTPIDGTIEGGDSGNLQGEAQGGVEILYRISPKMNIGVGTTAHIPFGKNADLLDGDDNHNYNDRTTYRDILHFPHVSLNFNIGKKSKSEPLYWVNPLGGVSEAIASLNARPVYDPTDTDGDGVIDVVDQEKDSPSGAKVDTRGVTLDSDTDGIADFKDKQPYSPPGYKVDALGVAQIPVEPKITETDVNRIVDAKLAGFKPASAPTRSLVDWFLPMIHFDLDQYNIKRGEYDKLYTVASVMKANPELRVVVEGHTDKSANNTYNNVLSYNRAKAAIDFLEKQYGISRDRLILNWGGEETTVVPTSSPNYLNRRVEFKVATTQSEMGRPEGKNAGKGRNAGNKDAGY